MEAAAAQARRQEEERKAAADKAEKERLAREAAQEERKPPAQPAAVSRCPFAASASSTDQAPHPVPSTTTQSQTSYAPTSQQRSEAFSRVEVDTTTKAHSQETPLNKSPSQEETTKNNNETDKSNKKQTETATTDDGDTPNDSGLSTGWLAGIAVGATALIGIGVFFYIKKK